MAKTYRASSHIPPTSINIKVFKPIEGMLHGRHFDIAEQLDQMKIEHKCKMFLVVGVSFSFCCCHFGLSCPSHKP